MSRVQPIKPSKPNEAPVVIESADPTPQVGSAAPLQANDTRLALDPSKINAVDSLGMGGTLGVGDIPRSWMVTPEEKLAGIKADKPVTKGGAARIGLSEMMGRLAADGFSVAAQDKFADKLKTVSTEDAAYMARALRQAAPTSDLRNAKTLSDAFAGHGLKLDPLAKTDNTRNYAMLDRTAFRGTLDKIVGDSNGVLTKGDILTILDMVNNVSDLQDLEFARKEPQ